jgi:uncharacterized membrane protein
MKRLYGHSDTAVYNQIRIAMITFCLSLLMKRQVNFDGTLWNLHKFMRLCWGSPFNVLIQKLFRRTQKRSAGRSKWNHERVFEDTLNQFERGDIDHLNDLTYDPII